MNDNQMRIVILLGSLLAVLLIILISVLVWGGEDDATVAGDAADPTTTVIESTTTTIAETTTTAAPTTTEAPTTTAASTTTTTTSTTTTTTTTMPPPNFALSFDGIDDFASIANTGDFDFGDGMTIEAWVKPTSLATSGSYAAIARGAFNDGGGGGGSWVLALRNTDHTDVGLSGCTPGCNAVRSGPGGLVVGEWQHIAGQYDGTTIQLYRNGQFVDSTPLSGDLSDFGFLILGLWTDSFHGLIDEVRVWSTPKGPFDIDADYDRILAGNEVGLVGYYRFDEGTGQTFADSSVAGNNGRLGSSGSQDIQDPLWTPSDIPIG